jgi:hypothetical protein
MRVTDGILAKQWTRPSRAGPDRPRAGLGGALDSRSGGQALRRRRATDSLWRLTHQLAIPAPPRGRRVGRPPPGPPSRPGARPGLWPRTQWPPAPALRSYSFNLRLEARQRSQSGKAFHRCAAAGARKSCGSQLPLEPEEGEWGWMHRGWDGWPERHAQKMGAAPGPAGPPGRVAAAMQPPAPYPRESAFLQ